jgi:hypothetical protein
MTDEEMLIKLWFSCEMIEDLHSSIDLNWKENSITNVNYPLWSGLLRDIENRQTIFNQSVEILILYIRQIRSRMEIIVERLRNEHIFENTSPICKLHSQIMNDDQLNVQHLDDTFEHCEMEISKKKMIK